MFTGLIEQQGEVVSVCEKNIGLEIKIAAAYSDITVGESIAVNGVCLTALPSQKNLISFDVSPQTLTITNTGLLKVGDKVNLERAMLSSARFGGHYVNGHVDTTAKITQINRFDYFQEIVVADFNLPAKKFLLNKGSIALNGVSLTINDVVEEAIKIMLVPHTLLNTNFGSVELGQRVNVEFDYLTRIVAHQLTIAGQLRSEVL